MPRWDWLGLGERRWTKHDDEEIRPAKTAWDWLQLLVVPAMLAAIAVGFNASQSSRDQKREDQRLREDRRRAEDVRREQNLQRYFDRISDLLLHQHLQHSRSGAVVRDLARAVTLSTLRGLDGRRKGEVVKFLAEAGLLDAGPFAFGRPEPIVSLLRADLSHVDLRHADLNGLSFNVSDLHGARFDDAILNDASFQRSNLRGASFRGATISTGSFALSNLSGARFDEASIGMDTGTGILFTETCLSGASFARAALYRARFDDAEATTLDLHGAYLRRVASLDGVVRPRIMAPACRRGVSR